MSAQAETKPTMPQRYRVEKVEGRIDKSGSPTYRVELSALYYGPDEDGPKVGQILKKVDHA